MLFAVFAAFTNSLYSPLWTPASKESQLAVTVLLRFPYTILEPSQCRAPIARRSCWPARKDGSNQGLGLAEFLISSQLVPIYGFSTNGVLSSCITLSIALPLTGETFTSPLPLAPHPLTTPLQVPPLSLQTMTSRQLSRWRPPHARPQTVAPPPSRTQEPSSS